MATYVNNLRLTELATGEGSGTWGTTTNTNLELIGEALGYGSEAVANASTHTITVADGTADSARSFYLKLTGGGQACTVTLAPNTLSKVWMVENTTNSTLTFSQGSGANVAIAAGAVKMIATDGAGSGAVVYDLLVDTDLTGTTTVVNLTSSGTIDAATVEFNSLSGTGSVAITDILDQDNMSSNSATALATQQSIKAYVDSSVASFDTLAEVLAQGNTTGSTDIEVTTAQKVQFRDSAIYINSSADGQLDIVADTEIQIAATTVDLNGNLDVSGTIAAGGVVTANAGVVVDNITIDGNDISTTNTNGNLTITPNGTGNVNINSDTVAITGVEGESASLILAADESDDNADIWKVTSNIGNTLTIGNQISGSVVDHITITPNATVADSLASFAGKLTTAGVITANAGVVVGNTTIGGNTYSTAGGDLQFTATAGNIKLSGDNGNVIFMDDTVQYGTATNDGSNFLLRSLVSDKDIIFKGLDGASEITALTLDMSDAGAAIFNGHGTFNDTVLINSTSSGALTIAGTGGGINFTGGNNRVLFNSNRALEGSTDGATLTVGEGYTTINIDGAATFSSTIAAGAATFTTADNTDTLSLISTDADANVGPNLRLYRNSGSPADSDALGRIQAVGRNDNSQDVIYSTIETFALDVSDGTEDAVLNFNVMQGGSAVSFFKGNNTEVVVNDDSNDLDFRVESNGQTHALFVNADLDTVGINSTATNAKLEVVATSGEVFRADANGGAYRIVANQDGVALNGNVGVGIAPATNKFEVKSTGSNATQITLQHSGNTVDIVQIGQVDDHGSVYVAKNSSVISHTISASQGVVLNEDSSDQDFRVESDGSSNMLFVDGGNNRIGIGDNLTNGALTIGIAGVGSYNQLTLTGTTSANANKLAGLTTLNYQGDNVSVFQSFNQSGSNTLYFGSADSSHRGYTTINTFLSSSSTATTNHRKITTASYSAFVVNEDGADVDFRVESDGNDHAIYVDGANNSVTLGSSSSASNTIRTQSSSGFQASTDGSFGTSKAYTFRDGVGIDNPNATSYSTATAAVLCAGAMSTGRSINATGTVNASGADYAEYEANNGLVISKGSIVGFKADGTLTLTFSEAVRFGVKSTDPAYVGGDTWSDVEPPEKNTTAWDTWFAEAEVKRAKVDRVAYSGKVPVNVQGATAGQYIIAVANSSGEIAGQAVTDPDFSQYKLSVGRVNKILKDGRAELAVIIH